MYSTDIELAINEFKRYALRKGFNKVVFRNHTTNQGDFCIFLYNTKIRTNGYCVGFDGYWHGTCNTFDNCLAQAYRYVATN